MRVCSSPFALPVLFSIPTLCPRDWLLRLYHPGSFALWLLVGFSKRGKKIGHSEEYEPRAFILLVFTVLCHHFNRGCIPLPPSPAPVRQPSPVAKLSKGSLTLLSPLTLSHREMLMASASLAGLPNPLHTSACIVPCKILSMLPLECHIYLLSEQ